MSRLHARFDLDALPEEAAVYLFARRFGLRMEVLYVGKGLSLRKRIKQQLNNTGAKSRRRVGNRRARPDHSFHGER